METAKNIVKEATGATQKSQFEKGKIYINNQSIIQY